MAGKDPCSAPARIPQHTGTSRQMQQSAAIGGTVVVGERRTFKRLASVEVTQQPPFGPRTAGELAPEAAPKDQRVDRPCVVGVLVKPATDRRWERVEGCPVIARETAPDRIARRVVIAAAVAIARRG